MSTLLLHFWSSSISESPRTTLVIQIAGSIPAISMKETFRSHSLLSSPSGKLSPKLRSALTIKVYTLETKTTRMSRYRKRRVMNQKTRSIQNVFVEQAIVEVTSNSLLLRFNFDTAFAGIMFN